MTKDPHEEGEQTFMGMTIAEKILARKSGLKEVRPGQFVTAKIDLLMTGEVHRGHL